MMSAIELPESFTACALRPSCLGSASYREINTPLPLLLVRYTIVPEHSLWSYTVLRSLSAALV